MPCATTTTCSRPKDLGSQNFEQVRIPTHSYLLPLSRSGGCNGRKGHIDSGGKRGALSLFLSLYVRDDILVHSVPEVNPLPYGYAVRFLYTHNREWQASVIVFTCMLVHKRERNEDIHTYQQSTRGCTLL